MDLQKYPHLCTRLGRSKNHIAKFILKKEKTPTQHKGRRVPLHLVEKVEKELQKLIEYNQIIRLEKCPDNLFISPVVITVKNEKSIKIALDSEELNKAIHKNKYQMQSIDHLTDSLAMQISSNKNKEGPWWFSKIDLKYASSQIPLDESIAEHCNFNILGGKATGTYIFIKGFYGLTDMPATFQKTIDKTLDGCKNYFAFLDDILIATKGKLKKHEGAVDTILNKLDIEGLAISLQKCEFVKIDNRVARIQNNSTWSNTTNLQNRSTTKTRPTKNIKTTTIPYGQHPSLNKIYSKFGRNVGAITPTIKKRQYNYIEQTQVGGKTHKHILKNQKTNI